MSFVPLSGRSGRTAAYVDLERLVAYFKVYGEIFGMMRHSAVRQSTRTLPEGEPRPFEFVVDRSAMLSTAREKEATVLRAVMDQISSSNFRAARDALILSATDIQEHLTTLGTRNRNRDDQNMAVYTGMSPTVLRVLTTSFSLLTAVPVPLVRAAGVVGEGVFTGIAAYGATRSSGGSDHEAVAEAFAEGTCSVAANLLFIGAGSTSGTTRRALILGGMAVSGGSALVPVVIRSDSFESGLRNAAVNAASSCATATGEPVAVDFARSAGSTAAAHIAFVGMGVNLAGRALSSTVSSSPASAADGARLLAGAATDPSLAQDTLGLLASSLGVNADCRPETFVERYLMNRFDSAA